MPFLHAEEGGVQKDLFTPVEFNRQHHVAHILRNRLGKAADARPVLPRLQRDAFAGQERLTGFDAESDPGVGGVRPRHDGEGVVRPGGDRDVQRLDGRAFREFAIGPFFARVAQAVRA